MAFDPKPIMSALVTIAKKSGLFANVNEFEPRGQPANGLTLALISGPLTPASSSGLNGLSLRWQIDGQIYLPMHIEPPKDIDFKLMNAAGLYLEDLCGQFTLGGLVRCVDVLGSDGERLSATPGYIDHNDKLYRVAQLMIPLVLNQKWTLTP